MESIFGEKAGITTYHSAIYQKEAVFLLEETQYQQQRETMTAKRGAKLQGKARQGSADHSEQANVGVCSPIMLHPIPFRFRFTGFQPVQVKYNHVIDDQISIV